MTETVGFAEPEPDEPQSAQPEPDESQAAEGVADPEPAEDAGTAVAPDPEPEPEPAEAVLELPPTAPFIPDIGVPGWLRDALLYYDQRHRSAGF
jgi:hypothetical protein